MSAEEDEPKIEQVELSKLRPGPPRHESLAEDQLIRARVIYKLLSPYLKTTFEQFESNFLRDAHPEQEIRIWSQIALAHQTFLQRNTDATDADAERAFKAFLLMSMGAPRTNDIPVSIWEPLAAIYEGR